MIVCTDETHFDGHITGESQMLPGVVNWMKEMRVLSSKSLIIRELPVNGRRVDLAVMTRSGKFASFELKIGGFARVLEQASYNQLSFDESWVIVRSLPRDENLASAREFGIGVIVFNAEIPRILHRPGAPIADSNFRARLKERMIRVEAMNV